MVKHLIVDISEKDFRKLHLKGYRHVLKDGRSKMEEVDFNELLDNQITGSLQGGYESDKRDLELPVTIAIHNENNDDYSGYLDKFMNRFTGLQTFQIGWGIKHLYSTRDYYEMRGDYWKVKKSETAIIYRIHLDKKWIEHFVLKHRTEIDKKISNDEWFETHYDLDETTGKWIKAYSGHIIKRGQCTTVMPVLEKEENEPKKIN